MRGEARKLAGPINKVAMEKRLTKDLADPSMPHKKATFLALGRVSAPGTACSVLCILYNDSPPR